MPNLPRALAPRRDGGGIQERVHHMLCVHGAAGHLEEPERVSAVREQSGLRLEAAGRARAIVCYPIPTTLVFRGSRLAIRSVLLDFTAGIGAALSAVQVFSGSRLIANHDGLGMSGRHRYRRFEVAGHPGLNMPVSVALAVAFGEGNGCFSVTSVSAVFVERAPLTGYFGGR